MNFKKILAQFDIANQCRKYGLSLWQCPQFLFLLMGIIIIASTLTTYFIGRVYIEEPQVIALIVLFIATILFVIATAVIQGFERLAEANRMKSEFISIVSHQLRSPLTNLEWTIEVLSSGKADSISKKQLEYLKILKENSGRMRELISNLLIVSRIEQNKLPVKRKKVSLKDLVEEAIRRAKVFARASNIKIEFKAEGGLPEIFTDPSQLKLVIENLLDNAIRYSKIKGKITLKLEKKDKNLHLEVKDKGVGVPQSDQKYIFQKFFRSANALRNQTEGSGLGLYIAKSITQQLKGRIGFESQEDVGSTFWLTLPLK